MTADPLADALLAARLCALDPGLGGMVLRGGGDLRDRLIAALRDALATDAPLRRLPPNVDDEALLGGIDLTATLTSGAPVRRTGLLAAADGGVLVIPMAERLSEATAARIAAALDTGAVEGEPARFVIVALDEGLEADEYPPIAPTDRLAFHFDLSSVRAEPVEARPDECGTPFDLLRASGETAAVHPSAPVAIAATAIALGVDSARASLLALRAARAATLLDGRDAVSDDDLALAARLVLAPRATRLPPADPTTPPRPETAPDAHDRDDPAPLDDIVLAAASAALPRDLLARLATGSERKPARAHGNGKRAKSLARGRPFGARAGLPGGGRRLALIDTLRAAAPWQRLRSAPPGRIAIRRDDLRIRRFEARTRALTIFAVDASGSTALTRLAEAKGAVELLLAQAHVTRAEVALLAFRGTAAEILLPPTRSLTRARRALAELPGGGGTPLAAGLDAARILAEGARAKGRTPFVVLLSDGRGNVAADGSADPAAATRDADAAARGLAQAGVAAVFVDVSPRPRAEGAQLAARMGARYLPLPRADASTMHAAVAAAQPA